MPYSWRVHRHGEPTAVLQLEETARPALSAGQIAVRVSAASCNFADVLLCRGSYQQRPAVPFTPGLEVCGRVTDVGGGVDRRMVGSRVLGQPLLPHGGFAEFAVLRVADAYGVPDGIDDSIAATLHLTYLTAWLGVHRRGGLTKGQTIVVTAAAGGVGSAAVQIAQAAGAYVIAIVTGPEKAAFVSRLGADVVIDRSTSADVVTEIKAVAPNGVDVVFESVGGESFEQATKYIGFEGRIVVVGFAGGHVPRPRLNHTMVKNYTIAGLHWSLYRDQHPELVQSAQRDIFDMFANGQIAPEITHVRSVDLPATLELLAAGGIRGKAVVSFSPG
jgi:NADPH2:quinone reductase